MSHYKCAAEGFIALEKKAGELANEIFLGTKLLAEECINSDLVVEFDKAMLDAEALLNASLSDGETLSKKYGRWKVTKSQVRKGLKAGIDPTKYNNLFQFNKATDEKTGGNSVGSGGKSGGGALGKGNSNKGGSNTNNNPTELQLVTSDKLSKAVQAKLNDIAKQLSNMSEEDAISILNGTSGAIRKKLKAAGGRYNNLKTG
ncbi:MAG: hypothetical protein JSW41_04905 [Candidatus Aenigmatarchaeota archaeon]|nr:MAG: hypothetical protein JSW41_04905 [Candidatus Aenigmarchaeota archaeon]